jgi:predicted alpha/beta superfamily hydrolase
MRVMIWFLLLVMGIGGARAEPSSPQSAGVEEGRPIVIGRGFSLASQVLHDTRRINVYLPDGYGSSSRPYAVLYLLDGGEKEDFLHISAIAQIIAAYGEAEPLIVVGIEGVDRRHDLTSPTSVASDLKNAPTAGGASAYRKFLVSELKPWVQKHYRTNGRSALIGESLAGLFVLETSLKAPESFNDYIAVSPSLWWNGSKLAERAADDLRRNSYKGQRLWVTFDKPAPPADEAERERAVQNRLESAFAAVRAPGLARTFIHSEEGHSSVYHPAAFRALRKLYAAPRPSPD